ncbi:Ubiquitin [Hexamita inflata]|uniref:Ubiquitin n=1 Tax=Hexamita inflata TaxID=28002 RepID=A0AA86R662_9EUKA|nr:Ubiquitin [Hexamita inflata]CAI9971295.1 Ubiquitin [Hexamita inflata]
MLIKVQLNTGYIINIDVDAKDTVSDLKTKIFEQQGIDPAQQRILYLAQIVNNQKTVEELNLRAGATMQLVINLRGG